MAGLVPGTPWPATDGLGRKVPLAEEVGPPRPDRFVGIFYFLWHQHAEVRQTGGEGPYDVAKILKADPDALRKPDSPLWGPIGTYHYWAEPLFGYYRSQDPWVLRRHAMLLADAGIDTLIFDATNALTYPEIYRALCDVFEQVRREGGRTPQIAFMVHTEAGKTAQKLFDELYRPGLHRDLWFQWDGKPLLLCDAAQASPELRAFFTLRRAHWPFELVNTHLAWHWEATYPQPYGFTDDPNRPEQVNVSIAQNLRQQDGKVTNMSDGDARGRSFHDGRQDTAPGAVNWGHNAREQWRRALELGPPFVMVTGWNEWIAGRWGKPDGPIVFVDQYDQEFSRDIEPMRGGHSDHYYWQLVANVRRFKGAPPLPTPSPPVTIHIDRSFAQWETVSPAFSDHVGESAPRDHAGIAGTHYTNRTGRHDLELMKVAHDRETVYFYLRCRAPLGSDPELAGLWLLLDLDGHRSTGWEGYEVLIGRRGWAGQDVAVERPALNGSWSWHEEGTGKHRREGNELHLAIPRRTLGPEPPSTALAIDFKWVDNARQPGNVVDFLVDGDAAPEGRFNFRYQAP